MTKRRFRALGLMSGTSLDGIDAAVIETDGYRILQRFPGHTVPYPEALREELRAAMTTADWLKPETFLQVEREMTVAHARCVDSLLALLELTPDQIDVIGFHGQTLHHAPDEGWTWQIGDGAQLAAATGIPVVNDLRSADMRAGGQGAPLAPLYHAALSAGFEKLTVVLNLGGVGNVTFLGEEILAFDTGPANAPLDDWVKRHTGARYDRDGALAASGQVSKESLARLLTHPYFDLKPPKSLDRNGFDLTPVQDLSVSDGAATLLAFSVGSVARACEHLPAVPECWIVCGGGRHNQTFLDALRAALPGEILTAEAVGWSGDFIEAEAFAYLAVRSLIGEPLSVPGTTGVSTPTTGGVLHDPSRAFDGPVMAEGAVDQP
ncbi:MAG: anhydro-N-acetylmuramic acid kinase, partial [Pseudomonadota bacterium]